MRYLVLVILCNFLVPGLGQDKEAKRVIEKLNASYASYATIEIAFALEIDYPDREIEKHNGTLIQDGIKYLFRTPDQEIYGDGKDVWLYLKDRNEVQINNYEEDEDLSIVTPKDLLRQYDTGQFDYAITEKSKSRYMIEFKPLDEDSDYVKFRLSVLRADNSLESIYAISKDGSRILFNIISLQTNQSYLPGTFIFNPSKYPGIFIEDLRID